MNDSDVIIAIDGMGGDLAPDAIVAGACRAAREWGCRILLVGDRSALEPLLKREGAPANVSIVATSETVAMDEAPAIAVRRGGATSMGKTIDLVRDGEAHAAFSAGNSGAFLALATIRLSRLPGIARPGFATAWPAHKGPMLLVDAGANVDCKAEWLVQFAVMGSAYSRAVLGIPDPKVGLLSVGEEESKGNALTAEAFPLLSAAPIHFIGNVEGRDLLLGDADVVVADGFVGNVALKTAEGTSEYIFKLLREAIEEAPIHVKAGAALLRPVFRGVRSRLDHRYHGGAPLLGVRGNCIIGHGRADALTVYHACKMALRAARQDLVGSIERMLAPAAAQA
ncbi:MAG TPA: phosphate acyltransferase PlsX [Candidatus Eremiobacteraceae bacterium]|nr:phosphate acyltransferase PlsX [Candidatus Eremiobacteraceae bacterium]